MVSIRYVKTAVTTLNLFRTYTLSDENEHDKKIQMFSTRLFLILLTTLMVILLTYTSEVQITQTININSPSISTYSSLYEEHKEKLTCPCTNIAITRAKFIRLVPIFHQVCSSDYVTVQWSDFINAASNRFVSSDFRDTGSRLFQILASFCQLANSSIIDSLPNFYSISLISPEVISRDQFEKETQSIIDNYIHTSGNDFSQSFELARDITFTDAIVTGLSTNFYYKLGKYNTLIGGYEAIPYYRTYDGCQCEQTPLCISPAVIENKTMDQSSTRTLFVVSGFYIGCYLVEAIRQSNLVCLYNQTCLDQLIFNLQSPLSFNATALVLPGSSRFHPSTLISAMLDELLVERWIQNISYPSYYSQCQISYCTYTRLAKNSFLYIITTLIGLFGGLYKALFISVPFVVTHICKRRHRIHPIIEPQSTGNKIVILSPRYIRMDLTALQDWHLY